jgi:hypothetical protein
MNRKIYKWFVVCIVLLNCRCCKWTSWWSKALAQVYILGFLFTNVMDHGTFKFQNNLKIWFVTKSIDGLHVFKYIVRKMQILTLGLCCVGNWDHCRSCWRPICWIGCLISIIGSVKCNGDCLFPILDIGKCKGDLFSTRGNVERILLHSMAMWTI